MKVRVKSTGYRQKAWDALSTEWPTIKALAEHLGAAHGGVAAYVRALDEHDYIKRNNSGGFWLARKTGPRAPSVNTKTGEFRDWNLEPAMDPADLDRVIKESGLSIVEWMKTKGLHIAGATRLRQMLNGQRPVSEEVAMLALQKP